MPAIGIWLAMHTVKIDKIIQAIQIFSELKVSAIFYLTKPKQTILVLGYRNNPIKRTTFGRYKYDFQDKSMILNKKKSDYLYS